MNSLTVDQGKITNTWVKAFKALLTDQTRM